MRRVEADTDSPASEQEPGPWDVYSQSIVGVSAVKSDVLVHVDNGPFMREVSNAFIAKAIDNLRDKLVTTRLVNRTRDPAGALC